MKCSVLDKHLIHFEMSLTKSQSSSVELRFANLKGFQEVKDYNRFDSKEKLSFERLFRIKVDRF